MQENIVFSSFLLPFYILLGLAGLMMLLKVLQFLTLVFCQHKHCSKDCRSEIKKDWKGKVISETEHFVYVCDYCGRQFYSDPTPKINP